MCPNQKRQRRQRKFRHYNRKWRRNYIRKTKIILTRYMYIYIYAQKKKTLNIEITLIHARRHFAYIWNIHIYGTYVYNNSIKLIVDRGIMINSTNWIYSRKSFWLIPFPGRWLTSCNKNRKKIKRNVPRKAISQYACDFVTNENKVWLKSYRVWLRIFNKHVNRTNEWSWMNEMT